MVTLSLSLSVYIIISYRLTRLTLLSLRCEQCFACNVCVCCFPAARIRADAHQIPGAEISELIATDSYCIISFKTTFWIILDHLGSSWLHVCSLSKLHVGRVKHVSEYHERGVFWATVASPDFVLCWPIQPPSVVSGFVHRAWVSLELAIAPMEGLLQQTSTAQFVLKHVLVFIYCFDFLLGTE